MARNDFGMGGGISPALYSGGAVHVNSDAFTNYYLQTKARQQAQDDSLLKYYGDLGKNLTPTGMHSNDVDDLVKMKTDWQNYGMQNKKAIARPSLDGGKAYQSFMSKYNDMQGLIAQSKDKVKNLASLHPVVMDPNKRSRLTQSTLDDISAAELPVRHPGYKPIDFNAISYSDKPFDLNDQAKLTGLLTKIKGNESVNNIVPDKKTGMQTVSYKNQFTPDQLNGMTNIAHNLYHNHPGFKSMIDKEADPLSGNYDQLNDTFKQHYGRDIGDGEDMATAHVLSMNPNRSGRQVVQKIPANPMDMLNAREASQKRLIDYRQNSKDAQGNQAIAGVDDLMKGLEINAKAGGSKDYIHANGQHDKAYDVKMTPELEKIFTKSDPTGKHKVTPDKVQLLENGDYLPVYYQKDEDGNPLKSNGAIAVNSTLTRPSDRNAVKASLGNLLLTKKTAEKQLSATPAGITPTKSKAEKPKKQIAGW